MTLGGEKQRYATIRKDLSLLNPRPNMIDYVRTKATFDWNGARSLLEGLPDGKGMNIAHEAVDRHARGAAGEHVAILWIGKSGERREITYRALREDTNRFANVLRSLGLGRGDRVFTLLGRVPELYIAVLGSLKANCVASPLFSAFGPEPIATRLELGEGVALVTTEALYKRKDRAAEKPAAEADARPARRRAGRRCRDPFPTTSARGIVTRVRYSRDGTRGYGAAPFHQRHHRAAEGGHPCP